MTSSPRIARTAAQFATTHWSTVLAAGDSASLESGGARERLCRTCWYPLYAFVRRKGHPPEDAGTSFTALISTDILGLPRALDGDGDGIARVDMGAYEFDLQSILTAFTHIELSADGLVLQWNDAAKGLKLQQTPTLTPPDWQDVPGSETTTSLTPPVASGNPFFRLVKP